MSRCSQAHLRATGSRRGSGGNQRPRGARASRADRPSLWGVGRGQGTRIRGPGEVRGAVPCTASQRVVLEGRVEFTSTKRPRDSTARLGRCEQRSEVDDKQAEFPQETEVGARGQVLEGPKHRRGEADPEGVGCCGRFSLSVWPLPSVWMVDRSFWNASLAASPLDGESAVAPLFLAPSLGSATWYKANIIIQRSVMWK